MNLEDYDDEDFILTPKNRDFIDNYYPVARVQKPRRGGRKKRIKEDPDYTVSCYDTKDLNCDGSSKRTFRYHESSPQSKDSDDKSNSSDEYYNYPVKPKSIKKVFNVITYPHSHGMHTRAHSKNFKANGKSGEEISTTFKNNDFGHKNGGQIKPCKTSDPEPKNVNPMDMNKSHNDQDEDSEEFSLFEDAEDDMEVAQPENLKGKSYKIDNFIILEDCFKSGNAGGFENSSEIASVHGREELALPMHTPVDTSIRDLQAQYFKAFSNKKQSKSNVSNGMARNQNEKNFINNSKKFESTHDVIDNKINNNFVPPLPVENVSIKVNRKVTEFIFHQKLRPTFEKF